MTSLEKLGISGIRSFGPREEQAIRFKKPLTIILGHNGAGKTTIIECIKMACTGDLPPFVDKGGAFIHDPRIQSDTETKGKIRMQFTDLAGRKIVVNRQFQLTNKVTTKKQEFKSVEQSVQIVDGDNEKLTLSQRHADVNKIVPELMGVTKAVLEHVVFVHQEESTWPLSDPKHLKEKFDDIFAATRYTKALEAIRKFKREKNAQLKEKTAELELWKEKVSQAEKLHREYAELQEQENELVESMAKLKEEQQTVESQKEQLLEKTNKSNELRNEIENLKAGKQSYMCALKDTYASMEEEFVETDEELAQVELEIKEQIRSLQQKKEDREKVAEEYRSKLEELKQRLSTLYKEKGHLEASRSLFEDKKSEYNQLKQTICEKVINENILELDSERIEETLEKMVNLWEARMKEELQEWNEREYTLQNELAEKESEYQKLSVQWKVLEHSLNEMRRKLETSASQDDSDLDLHRLHLELDNATVELESKQRSLQDLLASSDWCNLKNEKEELSKRLEKERKRFTDLCEERNTSKSDEEVASRFIALRDQYEDRKVRITKMEDKIKDCLATSEISELNAMRDSTMESISDMIYKLLPKSEQEEREKMFLVSKAETSLESLKKDLLESRINIEEMEKKMEHLTTVVGEQFAGENGIEAFEKALNEAEEKVREARETQKQFEGAEEFWKQLLARAKRKKCCPTCDRGFPTEADFTLLIEKLQSRADRVHQGDIYPSIVQSRKNAEGELEQLHKKQPCLNELENLRKTWKNAVDTRTKKEEEHKAWEEKLELYRKELASSKRNKDTLSNIGCLLQTRQSVLDELNKLEGELNQMNTTVNNPESVGRSRHVIDDELKSCNHEIEECSKRLMQVEQELEKYKLFYEALENEVKQKEEQHRALKERITSLQRRQQDLSQCREQVSQLEKQAKEQSQLVQKAELEWKECKSALETCRNQLAECKEMYGTKMNWARENRKRLDVLKEEMNRLHSSCTDDILQRLQREEESWTLEMKEYEKKVSEMEESTQTNATKIYELNATLRNIEANRNFRKTKAIIVEMENKMQQLQLEIAELEQDRDLVAELNKVERSIQTLFQKSSTLSGKREVIEERMKTVKKEMEKEQSLNSQEKYREKLVELKTLELSLKDLDQYHNALDRSLMTFHTLKMKEINKVIRELWQVSWYYWLVEKTARVVAHPLLGNLSR